MSSKKELLPTERDETPASDPFAWVYFARTLTFSGNIIFQKYESWRKIVSDRTHPRPPLGDLYEGSSNIVLNLYGLALENLVKELLIAKGTPPFVEKRIPPKVTPEWNPILGKYDLTLLFSRAKVTRAPEDEELLNLLTEAIEAGKYSIAKDAKIRQDAFSNYRRSHPLIGDMRPHIMLLPTGAKLTYKGEKARVFRCEIVEQSFDLYVSFAPTGYYSKRLQWKCKMNCGLEGVWQETYQ